MKIRSAFIAGICCFQLGCNRNHEAAIDQLPPLSPPEAESLILRIAEAGGEASLENDDTWSFSLLNSPERCLPISNEIPAIESFFLTTFGRELSAEELQLIRIRPETREFRILYGSLSPDAFGLLSEKFPRLERLVFWSPCGSDIANLPDLRCLTMFISDPDNFITVDEAKWIRTQESLTEVFIESAEAKEVFDILTDLPRIEELSVYVIRDDREELFELQ